MNPLKPCIWCKRPTSKRTQFCDQECRKEYRNAERTAAYIEQNKKTKSYIEWLNMKNRPLKGKNR